MFVVNPRTTPISIVAEYDSATIKGNGCGGVQVDNAMFINSGGSPVMVGPGHPAIYGFDVYRFPLTGFSATRPRNEPAPELLLSEDGMADSHGLATAGGNRYVWVMDRHADVVEIIEVATGQRVNTVNLNGALTGNAAPDLTDVAPGGNRIFVSLRSPTPLNGDPHNAMGHSRPGPPAGHEHGPQRKPHVHRAHHQSLATTQSEPGPARHARPRSFLKQLTSAARHSLAGRPRPCAADHALDTADHSFIDKPRAMKAY